MMSLQDLRDRRERLLAQGDWRTPPWSAPLRDKQLAKFEARHKLRLPDDFRAFLSSIGNGGIGPFHGLWPLGWVIDAGALISWEKVVAGKAPDDEARAVAHLIGRPHRPFPHTRRWNYPLRTFNRAEDAGSGAWQKLMRSYFARAHLDDTIPLCDAGCGNWHCELVSGANGRIAFLDAEYEDPPDPRDTRRSAR
jgi:hypothetical protein